MSARWFFTCPTCNDRYAWTGPSNPIPPCKNCQRAIAATRTAEMKSQQAKSEQLVGKAIQHLGGVTIPLAGDRKRYAEAIELCDEINETADEVPEAGEDFASSVREQAEGIRATIVRTGEVTDNQLNALDNMLGGLRKWIRE